MNNSVELDASLGPVRVLQINRPDVGLKAFVVVDNIALGPAMGGIRMGNNVTETEVRRLARAMTYKNAVADLPHGGGKAGILADPKQPREQTERLIRALGQEIKDLTNYIPGPDMGTDEECMAWMLDEIGRAIGLPARLGGIPLDEVGATGFGLAIAAEVASDFCEVEIPGARVVIQGFGAVGQHAARFLTDREAVVIGISDSQGTIYNTYGLDIEALIALKRSGKNVTQGSYGQILPRDAAIAIDCDIWIPAAQPDVITAENVHLLSTKLILQGANIPLTWAAEQICHDRNILVVPDFIANAGGVICGAVEYHGGNQAQAFTMIENKIRHNTALILEEVIRSQRLPRTVAIDLANRRIAQAKTVMAA